MVIASITVKVLVGVGIGLLAISLLPLRDILRMVHPGTLRRKWALLAALILFFICGYAVFAWQCARTPLSSADILVGLLLFSGSCFVAGIAFLSRQTVRDLCRLAELEHDAGHDPLTHLLNRRCLASRFNEEVSRAHRYNVELSVLMIDLDHFKVINDDYGHQTGDEILRSIGKTISTECRPSDITVRYGGDEILLIATNTTLESARELAERLRRQVKEMTLISGTGELITITVSIGLASLLRAESPEALLERADHALYRAKSLGRDRVCTHGETPLGNSKDEPSL